MIEIREGTKADTDAAVEFLMRMHNPKFKKWFEVMADGTHPNIDISNFIIAYDTDKNKIAASIIYQPWNYSYGGIILKGVRLEEAFCDPEYEKRKLIKNILDKIAGLATDKGCLFELVYGQDALYGLYNHFGYTFGIQGDMDGGYYYMTQNEETGDAFRIEEASDNDIPVAVKIYEKKYARNLLTTYIGCDELRHLESGYSGSGSYECKLYVIKSSEGNICGFFYTQTDIKYIFLMELDDSCSYHQIRPYLMEFYIRCGLAKIPLMLGASHPAHMVFSACFHNREMPEHGYVRVYDIPKFIMSIADVLNKRLSDSPYAHFTGMFTMAMHNHDDVYKIDFLKGKLTNVSCANIHSGEVNIERDRFIRLLFGRVSSEEINDEPYIYGFENEDYRNIYKILFPKMYSHIISLN